MCRKMFLFVAVAVVCISSVQAGWKYWDDGDPCNHYWANTTNWLGDAYPAAADYVVIRVPEGADPNGPVVRSGDTFPASGNYSRVYMGLNATGTGTGLSNVTVEGGTLNISTLYIGHGAYELGTQGILRINNDGQVNAATHAYIGFKGVGTLEINGGSFVQSSGNFYLGYQNDGVSPSTGVVDVNGGTLDLSAPTGATVYLGSNGCDGTINIWAGTMILADTTAIAHSGEGTPKINVCDGTFKWLGNKLDDVATLEYSGWLIGHGGRGSIIAVHDDGNDVTIVTAVAPVWEQAWNPTPLGTVDQNGVVLSWNAGDNTVTHQLYLGSNFDDVNDANTSSAAYVTDITDSNDYAIPYNLDLGATYYWRVDEVNDSAHVTKGQIWSFDVYDYVMLDDFEDYNGTNLIYDTWRDSRYDASNGAEVTVETAETKVYEGLQSMALYYDNSYSYSNATRIYDANLDLSDVDMIRLHFRSDVNNTNAEVLYVEIVDANDNAVKVTWDPNDFLSTVFEDYQGEFKQWNIDLQTFVSDGVDISTIRSITIGVGDLASAGDGYVYIDNITASLSTCVAGTDDCDIAGSDCTINTDDLDLLATTWLDNNDLITAVAPSSGPILWYKFDEPGTGSTCLDSANIDSNNYDGTVTSPLSDWSAPDGGYDGNCIDLETGGYIDVPAAVLGYFDVNNYNTGGATMSVWVKGKDVPSGAHMAISQGAIDGLGVLTGMVRSNGNMQFKTSEIGPDSQHTDAQYVGYKIEDMSQVQDQWNHWAFVTDKVTGISTIYLNGQIVAREFDHYNPISLVPMNLFTFGASVTHGFQYPCKMDDARLYNYALSHAEVLSLAKIVSTRQKWLPADISGDGNINFVDFANIASKWLTTYVWP